MALTVGYGDNAREILEESVIPISQNLKSQSDSLKTVSVCMICKIFESLIVLQFPLIVVMLNLLFSGGWSFSVSRVFGYCDIRQCN